MMKTLVVGASGATGKLLVRNLLERGGVVKAIVRSGTSLPEDVKNNENLILITASVHDLTVSEMAEHVEDVDSVVSCLGHNLTFKGIYRHPRRLVSDTVRNICQAIQLNKPDKKIKFILMNTSGNSNRDIPEKVPFSQKIIVGLIRLLLPPHVDNEKAADYLRLNIGQNNKEIEWVAVRPDTLVDEDEVTVYNLHPSPVRSPIFNPGKSSRINVAHFMGELIYNDDLWLKWRGQMPLLYNDESGSGHKIPII